MAELFGLYLECYMDYRANAYIVGEGPARLTVLRVFTNYDGSRTEEELDEYIEPQRVLLENALGSHPVIEEILFLAPTKSSIGAWRARTVWNIVRHEDNTVVAIHPQRDTYLDHAEDMYQQYKAKLELPLPTLISQITTARATFVDATDGRVSSSADSPMLVTNASKLSAYFEEVYDDDEQPIPPPPPCGEAVPDYTDNPGLMLDCKTLLGLKDALRGTGTLNWSVDVAMADWDGVRTRGTGRVTDIILVDKELTGTVPAALAALPNLEEILLSGNSLTGCIPLALRSVASNDLDLLGLPDCTE